MPAIPSTPSGQGALVTLDALGRLPAIDGSQLLGVGGGAFIDEQFVTSNLTNNTIGKLGWRTLGNGAGNSFVSSTIAGRIGVLSMSPGTAAVAGRRALVLGQSTVPGGFVLSTAGLILSPIEVEWTIRIRGTLSAVDLEMIQLGLVSPNDDATNGLVQDGVCVQFNPAASAAFRASATNAGVQQVQNGTTVVALDTWYRVAVVFTDTGSGGSLQLKVNGVNEGSPVVSGFTAVPLALFAKIDGQGVAGIDPIVDIDRVRVFYAQPLP